MSTVNTPKKTLERLTGKNALRKGRSGGDGDSFPLRVAKVTRVDSKGLVVDLRALTGNADTYEDVPLTFPNAGSRHFMGAIPQVNDLCVIGYAHGESGFSRSPYIVSWLVPGSGVGYDWLITQLTDPDSLEYNPKTELELQGLFGKRRHKLRQMDQGNIVLSSAQGADAIFDESLSLSNRRGNEIILRDSDQSLVIRTLQQFHAGSGFRIYGGMVQRDANLLPTWLFDDGIDYASPKQLDDEGNPLGLDELDLSDENGVKLDPVFNNDELIFGGVDPRDTLQKGLFIDDNGELIDSRTVQGSAYGGKSYYRVSKDLSNSVEDVSLDTFTEYRIEVAHTTDGTLPVTEQTDGIDIDRLPLSNTGDTTDKDANSRNRSQNAPMVEMVMGTVIGNDPINDPQGYGIPIVARIHDENGQPNPTLSPASASTPIEQHLAWLVKVNNPNGSAPPAFMGITKGGALKSYFPGKGSDTYEEFYESGRVTSLNTDPKGVSQKFQVQGSFEVEHNGQGSKKDNSGINLKSSLGYVNISAGGYSSDLAGRVGVNLDTPYAIQAQSKNLRLANDTTSVNTLQYNVNANDSANLNYGALTVNSGKINRNVTGDVTDNIHGNLKVNFTQYAPIGKVGVWSSTIGGFEFTTKEGNLVHNTNFGSVVLNGGDVQGLALDQLPNIPSIPKVKVPLSVELHSGLSSSFSADLVLHPTEGASLTSRGGITIDSNTSVDIGGTSIKLDTPFGVGTIELNSAQVTIDVNSLTKSGGVLTDGCKDHLTGRSYKLSGTTGVSKFRVR